MDAIDGAIRDWATSNDAMRWVPEGLTTSPAVSVDLQRAAEAFGRATRDALRALVEWIERHREELTALQSAMASKSVSQRDRPAYVSPYGPPPRRRRS